MNAVENRKTTPVVDPSVLAARLSKAKTDHAKCVNEVEQYRKELVATYGIEIRIKKVKSPASFGVCQLSWAHNRDHHVVELDAGYDIFYEPHLRAHELTHIELASKARTKLGFVQSFGVEVTLDDNNAMSSEDRWKHQILTSAYDRILDMVVEYRVMKNVLLKAISAAQFLSLHIHISKQNKQLKGYREYMASTPKDQLPPDHLATASLAIDCANALFLDQLSGGFTHYFSRFIATFDNDSAKALAEKVCGFCQERIPGLEVAGEYGLVDEVMGIVGLNGLYQWHRRTESEGSAG